jgi:type I restriction enzyme M protein
LEGATHQTFTDLNAAESALAQLGLAGKELALALKSISATDPAVEPMIGKKGKIEADGDLRDTENVQLPTGFISLSDESKSLLIRNLAEDHLAKEIQIYVSDAWIDHSKTKIGYEIPFTRQFYSYQPPRPVDEIRIEIENLEQEIQDLMREIR